MCSASLKGYLSRLRNGGGNPSPVILATLTLLANDPNRIAELAGGSPTKDLPMSKQAPPFLRGETNEPDRRQPSH